MARRDKPQKSSWGSSPDMFRNPSTVGKKGGCLGLTALVLLAGPAVTVAVRLFA